MPDENPGPLFAHHEAGPRFAIKDLSRALTKTGLEYPTAYARVAAYTRFSHVHVREKVEGVPSPKRYALPDLTAAVLLSAVQDTGISDQEVIERVSAGLYSWTPGVRQTGHSHPAGVALAETIQEAAVWQLLIDFYRNIQTGERRVDVRFFRAGEIDPNSPPPMSDGERNVRQQHPDAVFDEHPVRNPKYVWTSRLLIPASDLLLPLKPIVAPSGN